jgi:hypothetical protein
MRIDNYSERSVINGLTCAARRAGNRQAVDPTVRIAATAPAKTHGSVAETPQRKLLTKRVRFSK